MLFLFAALVSLGFGALGSFLALRTGSGESIQGLFPGALRVPVHLVDERPTRPDGDRAGSGSRRALNPVSYLIECVRSLIITGWDAQALVLGFGVAIVLAVIAIVAASWALGRRMERT